MVANNDAPIPLATDAGAGVRSGIHSRLSVELAKIRELLIINVEGTGIEALVVTSDFGAAEVGALVDGGG